MPRKSSIPKSDSNGSVDVQPTPDQQPAPIDFVDGAAPKTPDTTATDKVAGDPNWSVFDETDKTGKPDVISDTPDYTDGQYSGWSDVDRAVDAAKNEPMDLRNVTNPFADLDRNKSGFPSLSYPNGPIDAVSHRKDHDPFYHTKLVDKLKDPDGKTWERETRVTRSKNPLRGI